MEDNQLEIVHTDTMASIVKAEIDIQIATARAYPRSLKLFVDRSISLATLNEEVAASCIYALPRQGKLIKGPSARLAEIVCSQYEHIRSGSMIVANDGKTVTARGFCHDLQTNNFVAIEVKRRITDRTGKTFNEDMQTVTGNAACSIAQRNAIFKVIPRALVDQVYKAAEKVAQGDAKTLVQSRSAAVAFFKKEGISEKQICELLELKRIEDIDLDHISTLRAMIESHKAEEITLNALFNRTLDEMQEKAQEQGKAAIEDLKANNGGLLNKDESATNA